MCKEKNHNIRDKVIPKPQLMVNPQKTQNPPDSPLLTPFNLDVQQIRKFPRVLSALGCAAIYNPDARIRTSLRTSPSRRCSRQARVAGLTCRNRLHQMPLVTIYITGYMDSNVSFGLSFHPNVISARPELEEQPCTTTLHHNLAPQPCTTTLHHNLAPQPCTTTLHHNLAPQPCTTTLHHNLAPQPCTTTLHHNLAPQPCTTTLHHNLAPQPCTTTLHHNLAPQPCTTTLHHNLAPQPCTTTLHHNLAPQPCTTTLRNAKQ